MATVHQAVAPSRPDRPLRKDAARNRELLIRAARIVFAERGLDATLDDVAQQAGLGVGTAYRHFANKYELATAIFEHTISQLVDFVDDALAYDDPWQGLVAFMERVLELQTADRGLREVLMGAHDPRREELVFDQLFTRSSELVDRARRSGALRVDCANSDLVMIVMMLCQVADMTDEESPQLWRRYLPLVLDSLHRGTCVLPVPGLDDEQLRRAMTKHKQAYAKRVLPEPEAGRAARST